MSNAEGSSRWLVERQRLMGIVLRIRWLAIFFLALPLAVPGAPTPVLLALMAYLVAYNGATLLARRRVRTLAGETWIAGVSFAGDIGMVVLTLGLLLPDPSITAPVLIPFLAISGSAHFRLGGSIVGGAIATAAHLVLLAARDLATDGALDASALIERAVAFGAVTLLIVLVLAELERMRDQREALGREHAALEAAARIASYDPVTDLASRSLFVSRAAAALGSPGAMPIAVLVIRVDTADMLSTFGYSVLDDVRRSVATRLTAVAGASLTARLAGDDFAILAPRTDVGQAIALAERILHEFEVPFDVAGRAAELAASIGIATTEHAREAEMLIRHAGIAQALAHARYTGMEVYSPALDRHDPARIGLVADLRRALELSELTAAFQPKVALATGELIGAELLARWTHPTRGPIPPDVFIPLAEASLLRRPLLRWSVRSGIAEASALAGVGRHVPIAVNVSPRDLLDPTLTGSIASLLEERALAAALLCVEVTEGAIMDDPERCVSTLTSLRGLGIHLSIDDFGTGHSSLMYLHRLPVHEVKIDRSFVRDVAHNRSSRAVVRAAVTLAKEIGLEVIAEGVEDHATVDVLLELGCDGGQGYLFSPGLRAEALASWVASHGPRRPAVSRPP